MSDIFLQQACELCVMIIQHVLLLPPFSRTEAINWRKIIAHMANGGRKMHRRLQPVSALGTHSYLWVPWMLAAVLHVAIACRLTAEIILFEAFTFFRNFHFRCFSYCREQRPLDVLSINNFTHWPNIAACLRWQSPEHQSPIPLYNDRPEKKQPPLHKPPDARGQIR